MKYLLHTTTMEQRKELFKAPYKDKEIRIDDFLDKTIAFDEDTSTLYEVDYTPMLETLKQFDAGETDPEKTVYFRHWVERKGFDSCRNRVLGFKDLYESIKKERLKQPISVTNTGQKIDGSHRAAIMKHLGHVFIKAREHKQTWRDVDADFIKRTAEARNRLFGKNYYFIDLGGFTNIEKERVYFENSYERWEILKTLIKPGYILDVGCNEGFMSIMCALNGSEVTGYDHEFIEGANFHKLVFEFNHQKDLPVTFIEGNIVKESLGEYDTALLLNVIYHIPQQNEVMRKLRKSCKTLIMQGNLRKAHEVEKFNGCTVETMKKLCEDNGWTVQQVIEWRDKPILIAI